MSTADERRAGGVLEEKSEPPLLGGCYRLERPLKKNLDGATYQGTDLVRSEPVIIKTVRAEALSPVAHMRLEREAAVLCQLHGRHYPLLLKLGRDGDLVYLVMPYIGGVTLQSRLRQGSHALSVPEALTVGIDLFTTLQLAHAHGVLHRDVRPANILVEEDTPLQGATLTDFGLARSDRLDVSIRDQPVETARYLSPEGAGLLNQDVDECSDLYSAGIVLFECLAGRPPFQGANVGEVLRQHMTVPPPELRTLGLPVPRVLDEVVQRLLRKDPRDRYQSAVAVLADLRAIADGLDTGEIEPDVVVGLHDLRRTLTEPAFVGRGSDLAVLDSQMARARAGQGGVVFLEAESGGGKTRLLIELAQRTIRSGIRVMRGQGVDQMAQRPFQILAGVTEELVATARAEPALAARLQEKLADHRDAVCAVLPELNEILGTAKGGLLGPEAFAETRTLQALTVLLDSLGEANEPALVLLDDCQWADQMTLKLLGNWWRRQEVEKNSGRHVLVVAAFRTEEVAADHLLRTLQPTAHLTLAPFGAADVQQLAESMAGPLPAEALVVVQELGEGSPFVASAVLRGLLESGALVPAAAGWQVEPLALADISSSRHAGAFLARRLKLLPAPVIRLLTIGALLGKEFDLNIAASLAEQTSSEAIAALDEARRRHLIWVKAQEGKCAFVHDKLRETLLDGLLDGDRQELHREAALFLEKHHGDRHFDLAYHFDAAGESEHALPHALAAAERARSQHSLEIAEQQYRIALRGAEQANRATRYRIAEGLGDVLMLRGRYDESSQQTEAARDLAEGDVAKAQIEGKLGELAFKRGDLTTAMVAIEHALEQLGHKAAQSSVGYFLQLLREVFVQVLHTLLPGLFVARKKLEEEGVAKQLLIIRLLNRLAYAYWFKRGQVPCLWSHLRGMNLAERYPLTVELAQAYSIHAPVMSMVAYFSRGISYAQKSVSIYKSFGDRWGQGQASSFLGMVFYVASRFEEGIEKCRESIRLLERTGDVWEVNIARHHVSRCLYRMGDLPGAVAEARRMHQSGAELGDIQAMGMSLDIWSVAAGGQISPETVQVEMQRERADVQVTAQVMLAEGVRLLRLDRVEEASVLIEEGHQLAEKAGVRNHAVFPLRPWLATALRRQAEKISSWEPERRTTLLKRASKAAQRAMKGARKFQNDLPHALREAGLVAAMQGLTRRARQHLDESLLVAERQGARFEHAQTLLARGRLGLVLGWSRSDEDVVNARQTLQRLGADFALEDIPATAAKPATLSLADRFDTVLDAGRRIASALSREAIFHAVREAALQLLRGERCLLLKIKEEDGLDGLTGVGAEIEVYSRAIGERARALGKVVVFAGGPSEQAGEAALLAGVRSALCAPIFVRGIPIGCFYVDHRQVSGLFGADEVRLAEFIATIAGAALENAEGFAELRHLNETLEERVAERTAAAEAWAKELARSNAELELFASVASHDLQEPLRMVSSYMDLLAQRYQGQLDDKAERWIGFAVDGTSRMKELINDLLEFSRVGTRSKPPAPTDCAAVTQTAVANLQQAIRESSAVVTHGPLPTVRADAMRMTQLLQNLISNAIKYRGPVPPEVRIEAERQEGEWLFSVRDNGIGIDPQFAERIFVIFQRLHTRAEYSGTGIGLAICKKIVERHGGRIWVESLPGQGATFYFTIADQKGDQYGAANTRASG